MNLKINRVHTAKGLLTGSRNHTLAIESGNLYIIQTGKYINDMPVRGQGVGGAIGNKLVQNMKQKNDARLAEVEEKIDQLGIQKAAQTFKSWVIPQSDIESAELKESKFKGIVLKLKTRQKKFTFIFGEHEISEVENFVNHLK